MQRSQTKTYQFPTGVTLLHREVEPITVTPVEIDTSNPKLNAWRAVRKHWKGCHDATCPGLKLLEDRAKKAKDIR